MSLRDYLNSDQLAEMDRLDRIPPEQRCYCGWYDIGKCPHCPVGKTCADKLAEVGRMSDEEVERYE